MTKKINTIRTQKLEAEKHLAEIAALELEAQKEEVNIIETAEKNINDIAKLNGLFCGVILNHADLVAVLDLALRTGESVKIPFRLYFNE
jgi:citrate lyase beta subunit